jgi:hypothetical protein
VWDSCDKTISNTCNKRRPDLIKDFKTHILIVEIDENQHKNYNKQCEINRINELFIGFANRKIIFIRFNPDSYINKNGKEIKSCFSLTPKIGKLNLDKKKLETRIKSLHKQVLFYSKFTNIENRYNPEPKQVYLYFDEIINII